VQTFVSERKLTISCFRSNGKCRALAMLQKYVAYTFSDKSQRNISFQFVWSVTALLYAREAHSVLITYCGVVCEHMKGFLPSHYARLTDVHTCSIPRILVKRCSLKPIKRAIPTLHICVSNTAVTLKWLLDFVSPRTEILSTYASC
jgi:hypothetical protein